MNNLETILERLDRLEKAVFNKPDTNLEITENKKPKVRKTKNEDLTAPVKKLYDTGFFKEPKIDLDVLFELQKKMLTNKKPLRASVVNVLRKMTRNEIIERVDILKGKKTLIAYQDKK